MGASLLQLYIQKKELSQKKSRRNLCKLKNPAVITKGRLILEWYFGVFKSSKKWTFLTGFHPSLNMGQIQKLKVIYYIG